MSELPSIQSQPVFNATSSTAGEQLSITNKGSQVDYPTSYDLSNAFVTVTIRWSQNFDSAETHFDVWINESSTTLAAGLAGPVSAGNYLHTFKNAQVPYAGDRSSWTFIARVWAIDQTGATLRDEYSWTVTVQGFVSSRIVITTSTTSVTSKFPSLSSQTSATNGVVSRSSFVVTQSSVVSQTSIVSSNTLIPKDAQVPGALIVAIILVLALIILWERRSRARRSESHTQSDTES